MRREPKWVKSGLDKSRVDVTLLVQPIAKSCRLCLWTTSVLWSLPLTCRVATIISHLDCGNAPFWAYLVLVPYPRPGPHVVAREISLNIWALWLILQSGDEKSNTWRESVWHKGGVGAGWGLWRCCESTGHLMSSVLSRVAVWRWSHRLVTSCNVSKEEPRIKIFVWNLMFYKYWH